MSPGSLAQDLSQSTVPALGVLAQKGGGSADGSGVRTCHRSLHRNRAGGAWSCFRAASLGKEEKGKEGGEAFLCPFHRCCSHALPSDFC